MALNTESIDVIALILDYNDLHVLFDTYNKVASNSTHLVRNLTYNQFARRLSRSFSKYDKFVKLSSKEIAERDRKIKKINPDIFLDVLDLEAEQVCNKVCLNSAKEYEPDKYDDKSQG